MTLYNVHIYREMRLYFPGIEAATPEKAAAIAVDKPTCDAEYVEDCDGENVAALIDTVDDEDFEKSITVDFEVEKQRKAAPEMLAALQAASDWIAARVFVPRTAIQATIQAAIAKATADQPNQDAIAEHSALPDDPLPIVIEVRGGVVQDVRNVPPGHVYEIKDYDDLGDQENAEMVEE